MTARSGPDQDIPLYVDLDGTLTTSDTLWESLCLVLRRHPAQAMALPGWLLLGKSVFKAELADRVHPDAALLPYHAELLKHLAQQKSAGRRIVLATAAHERIANAVAEELDCFDAVLATTPSRNLRGAEKLSAILEDSGGQPFEYAGDTTTDLEIWSKAAAAIVVSPSSRLKRAVENLSIPTVVLAPARPGAMVGAVFRALRPHQWVKNALLFAPITLAQQLGDGTRLVATFVGFFSFCCLASFGYLVNDLLDIEADRCHESKRNRPFAAGTLPIPVGLAIAGALLVLGFGSAFALVSATFGAMLAIYLTATLAYSFSLKERLFLDVLILAGLYTHRVLSGGVASGVEVSTWLLAFSVFFFLSLALVKRYVELLPMAKTAPEEIGQLSRRAYQPIDLGLVETMGISSGYLSVLVLGLYVSRDDVTRYYAHPELLWLITPLMLYWISRVWFLARRGELAHDPVLFAATDRVSYFVVVGVAVIGAVAALWGKQ